MRRIMCRVHRHETDSVKDERSEEHHDTLLAGRRQP